MKKLLLVLAAVVLISAFTYAEGAPKAGEFGIQGGVTFTGVFGPLIAAGDLGAKYWLSNALALRAGVGFDNNAAPALTTTAYDLGVGFEYHFAGKGGVSPYAGAALSYSGESFSTGGPTASDFGVKLIFGGEYFFSDNFSWAGELGLGYLSAYNGATTTTLLTTFGMGTFLTYYF